MEPDQNMCSHYCTNVESSYSCDCDEGVTLASDGYNCGGMSIVTNYLCIYITDDICYFQSVPTMGLNICTETKSRLVATGGKWLV